jgi:hypothetical protein
MRPTRSIGPTPEEMNSFQAKFVSLLHSTIKVCKYQPCATHFHFMNDDEVEESIRWGRWISNTVNKSHKKIRTNAAAQSCPRG